MKIITYHKETIDVRPRFVPFALRKSVNKQNYMSGELKYVSIYYRPKYYASCAMMTPITGDEIYKAANNTKTGKSSGIDDIHAEHI